MANLYKKPVVIKDPKTGQKVKTKSKKWWGRFRDENGAERCRKWCHSPCANRVRSRVKLHRQDGKEAIPCRQW